MSDEVYQGFSHKAALDLTDYLINNLPDNVSPFMSDMRGMIDVEDYRGALEQMRVQNEPVGDEDLEAQIGVLMVMLNSLSGTF